MEQSELSSFLGELFEGEAWGRELGGDVLVVAAHPDDEVIGASWLLSRATTPVVVHVTDGAPHDVALWPPNLRAGTRLDCAALRRREAEQALSLLGLPPPALLSLGYADQQAVHFLCDITHALWSLLAQREPAWVVTHPYEGGHPDHDATAVAVRAALMMRRRASQPLPRLLEMSSYHRAEGGLQTGTFLPHGERELRCRLTPVEREKKRAMLAAHHSQAEVLAAFGCDEERYRRAPAIDVREPPHLGALHYETLPFGLLGERFRSLAADALARLGLTGSLP